MRELGELRSGPRRGETRRCERGEMRVGAAARQLRIGSTAENRGSRLRSWASDRNNRQAAALNAICEAATGGSELQSKSKVESLSAEHALSDWHSA